MSWDLSKDLESKSILITGYIVTPPVKKERGTTFIFKVVTINGLQQDPKIKLGWYKDAPNLKAGDKWQLQVRLKRPHGVLNPGGFDLEKHLLVHHIRATGYVVNSENNRLLSSLFYHYPIARFRQYLIDQMDEVLGGNKLAPIIIAFVTGSEDKIHQKDWQIMRNTGTSYLVAISGLHIGLVASVVFMLVQLVWRLAKTLPLIVPARIVGILVGLIFGFIYSIISGFSVPTQRALVMLTMFSLTVIFRRYSRAWNAWLWSLFWVLLINPLALLTIGFWLSFGAVAAIIYVSSGRLKQNCSHIKKFWRMQFAVTLTLLPFTLLFFQQFSWITIIANVVAMPAVCLVIVPISLLGALVLLIAKDFGGWILYMCAQLLSLVWWWLEFLSDFGGCDWNWYHPIYNVWILIATIIGVVLILAPRGFPGKALGLIFFLPLFFYAPPKPQRGGEVWFELLDVGQGLAAVIRTKNRVLLYDAGPSFIETDAGIRTIVPYLRYQGIDHIDSMVISHGDDDHIGGAYSILKSMAVSDIITSVPDKFLPRLAKKCRAGQYWRWDGVDFQILSPLFDSGFTGNNSSCVLKITSGDNSILLPGDIEKKAEKILTASYPNFLESTILVAPHHGSNTSSTDDFVDLVKPKYVLFPVGYKNRFRLPHKKIITRYLANGAILVNSSQTGRIAFKFNNKSDILNASFYREACRHFWHNSNNHD